MEAAANSASAPQDASSIQEVVTIETTGAGGGNGIGSDFFVGGADEETVIQLKEEEVIETPENVESAEMSVAMEMAKLSQQVRLTSIS